MTFSASLKWPLRESYRGIASLLALSLALAAALQPSHATTTALADQPLFTSNSVPGNLLLALSVEFPTAISVANSGTYVPATAYIGYFDNLKCYAYRYDANTDLNNYFYPTGFADANHNCASTNGALLWSGNYMNWAAMQTIDPFRFALTGGYRVVDTTSLTILEKAWASTQGSASSNFPDRATLLAVSSGTTPFSTARQSFLGIPVATPYVNFGTRIWGAGNLMYFTATTSTSTSTISSALESPSPAAIAWDGASALTMNQVYYVKVRNKVCDASIGLESNCQPYGSNYKPEGLMQQYNQSIHYGAFGYLNDGSILRDAGVLRARMNFVGPTLPVVNSPPATNPTAEWDPSTGIYALNPDSADASATNTAFTGCNSATPCATQSGVMNYLNKFGETSHSYKTYDPVSELYYAASRYYRNWINNGVPKYPNPPQWSAGSTNPATNATYVDGFPVITTWDDPILYACQKNFILGIGDIHTHDDGDLPGAAPFASNEPTPQPPLVAADLGINVQTATNMVATLENLETATSNSAHDAIYATEPIPLKYIPGGDQSTYLMAGIAYDAHTNDQRPGEFLDSNGLKSQIQTVTTYWLDVLESRDYQWRNQFWLAAKYGGFTVPSGGWPTYTATTPLTQQMWNANGGVDTSLGGAGRPQPDNYYDASHATTMVQGLAAAFKSISASLSAFSTSFSLSNPVLTVSNSIGYSAQYTSGSWSGDVAGQPITGFDSNGNPIYGAGWDGATLLNAVTPSSRIIITCCAAGQTVAPNVGVQFTTTQMLNNAPTKLAQLTSVSPLATSAQVLAWLTGDHSYEVAHGGTLRNRAVSNVPFVLGDIVDSQVVANGPPAQLYSETTNVGYSSFATTWANRIPVAFVGANDGMLHAFNGTVGNSNSGQELFGYIPSATYNGPTAPATDGLISLANPNFTHHYFVDATPYVTDVDLSRVNTTGTGSGNWHSILVGGLGKGGKSYYAIDVTDPQTMHTSEAVAAQKVLWEFTDATMGFSYGQASIVKTKKYGWTVIFTSGYDNVTGTGADGQGYFYFVNPATGALYEKVSTGVGSVGTPSGLGPSAAFVNDYTDGTADAVYAGDLLGNVWRVDLTGTSGLYPAPLLFATVTGPNSNNVQVPQPITIRPLIEIQPGTDGRRVLVGTGELLSTQDISSTNIQSFYSIADGTSAFGKFATTATLPKTNGSATTFPITRSDLIPVALSGTSSTDNLITGIRSSSLQTYPEGFYVDLTGSTGSAYRINVGMVEDQGVVVFAANQPVGDACDPTGTNISFAINIGSAQSLLTDSNGNTVAYSASLAGVATSAGIIAGNPTCTGTNCATNPGSGSGGGGGNGTGSGTCRKVIVCNQLGTCVSKCLSNSTGGLQKLNWREILSPN